MEMNLVFIIILTGPHDLDNYSDEVISGERPRYKFSYTFTNERIEEELNAEVDRYTFTNADYELAEPIE